MGPKQVSRLMRFDHAKQLITEAVGRAAARSHRRSPCRPASTITPTSTGTSPRLTGTSPTGWLAEERRNIQAGGHRELAEWES